MKWSLTCPNCGFHAEQGDKVQQGDKMVHYHPNHPVCLCGTKLVVKEI